MVPQIIEELIAFVNRHAMAENLFDMRRELGELNLRRVLIELLDWLKMQRRCLNKPPLKVEPKFSWGIDLNRFIKTNKSLSELFEVNNNNQCDFRSIISESERDEIRFKVDEDYNPRLFHRGWPNSG